MLLMFFADLLNLYKADRGPFYFSAYHSFMVCCCACEFYVMTESPMRAFGDNFLFILYF